jgi:palmitoyltransferase ZDHHC9/14/18
MADSDVEALGAQSQATAKQARVFEQWEGNEKFFMGGRVIAGPNWKASIGTAALVLVPAGVFLAWPAWYMGNQVSWAIFAFG